MNETKTDKKEYLPSISFWPSKAGTGLTCGISEAVLLEAVANIKVGSRLFIKFIPEEFRQTENAPHARLVIFPPEDAGTGRPTFKKGKPELDSTADLFGDDTNTL